MKPSYYKRNCSDCINYMSITKALDANWYLICGVGRFTACKYFEAESQTD